MTPPQAQEAGIDFEEARRTAEEYVAWERADYEDAPQLCFCAPGAKNLSRAYLALLATHEGEKARYREDPRVTTRRG